MLWKNVCALTTVLFLTGCGNKFDYGDTAYHKLTRQKYLIVDARGGDLNPTYTVKYLDEKGTIKEDEVKQAELWSEQEYKKCLFNQRCEQLAAQTEFESPAYKSQ